ncbi:unnamed protein product [Phytophthora fragariaefolia]|uniref:Unnamed protein product n=1 Tax=Phytophthora fragariaefolia TaxID=1490495 RepID=A0A9W6U8R0_9STRA|nr:unnamed protein product [Phytophthora fragariaefolia]
MHLDQAISLWRGRVADAALLGASSSLAKDNTRLVLLTSGEDVRELCAQTRKCVNHWTFRAGSAHALHVPAVRHPHSRAYFGVCGAPGVSASKKARQARRQEANKTAALPANEGLAIWRDTDLDVAKWRRTPLQSSSKAFALLAHPRLKEEVVVVFQDGSFATYDEDANRALHSDNAKDATAAEEEDEDEDEQEETVVWAYLESDHVSPMKGGLFLSLLVQKINQKGEKQYELLVYQVDVPNKTRRTGGVLAAVLLVRRRVSLPGNEELSSCAFHPITFSYSFVGCSGVWYTLRFARDALSNAITLVSSQQLPNLASADEDTKVPLHKKRKLQTSDSGYLVTGVGGYAYLVSVPKDTPAKYTGWDSKFAVPVTNVVINLESEKNADSEVIVGRSSKDSVGKVVQLVSVGTGDGILAVFERGIYFMAVQNKNSTLASVLGSTATSATEVTDIPALPNSSVEWSSVTATSSATNDTLDAEIWKTNMCSDDDRERQLIADLSDPQVTSTGVKFSSRLNEALKKQKKRKADNEVGEVVSFRLLQTVTRRCLESTDLKLWGPLEIMLRTNRLSTRAEPNLLPTLMKHNQFGLLECAIGHLIDIDERSIVRLMKYFIRKSSNPAFIKYSTKQVKAKKKDSGDIDGSAACERFAVALLGLPTNSVFLHRAIRELELEEVLLVLAFCKKLLLVHTTGDDATDDEEKTKSAKKAKDSLAVMREERRFTPIPSVSRCCMWICALLDAHLSALVQRASQHPKVASTLHQLDNLVQLQLRASAQYESVHGVLTNFLSGVRLPKAPGIPDYSIEELRL